MCCSTRGASGEKKQKTAAFVLLHDDSVAELTYRLASICPDICRLAVHHFIYNGTACMC
jgi:hypothetical protein